MQRSAGWKREKREVHSGVHTRREQSELLHCQAANTVPSHGDGAGELRRVEKIKGVTGAIMLQCRGTSHVWRR